MSQEQKGTPMPQPQQVVNVYPEGHPPFVPGRLILDDAYVLAGVEDAARKVGVVPNLISAYLTFFLMQPSLEDGRVHLFRAEAFMDTDPLAMQDIPLGKGSGVTSGHLFLAHDAPVFVGRLKAATQCLEEWLESKSRHAMLARYRELRRRP
jgi:hypothetical protein